MERGIVIGHSYGDTLYILSIWNTTYTSLFPYLDLLYSESHHRRWIKVGRCVFTFTSFTVEKNQVSVYIGIRMRFYRETGLLKLVMGSFMALLPGLQSSMPL